MIEHYEVTAKTFGPFIRMLLELEGFSAQPGDTIDMKWEWTSLDGDDVHRGHTLKIVDFDHVVMSGTYE